MPGPHRQHWSQLFQLLASALPLLPRIPHSFPGSRQTKQKGEILDPFLKQTKESKYSPTPTRLEEAASSHVCVTTRVYTAMLLILKQQIPHLIRPLTTTKSLIQIAISNSAPRRAIQGHGTLTPSIRCGKLCRTHDCITQPVNRKGTEEIKEEFTN